ncbi:hypothetical protein NQ318_015694 [Aromia moschata]|uniref:Uncharacterized protein n=1 Tax=Aromia moschata TaxID=1265417 RepID=A0AAV8YHW5_9CUCU|nr:hypothetical protein NQ318_015694 [Aromia moschata]
MGNALDEINLLECDLNEDFVPNYAVLDVVDEMMCQIISVEKSLKTPNPVVEPPLESLVRKFWEVEDIPSFSIVNPDDEDCENIFKSTYSRDITGRYTVALPFKLDASLLGDSYQIALRRFQRILWRSSPNDPIDIYELTTVSFGIKPSPFLAMRTVRQLSQDEKLSFPLASEFVAQDIGSRNNQLDSFLSCPFLSSWFSQRVGDSFVVFFN